MKRKALGKGLSSLIPQVPRRRPVQPPPPASGPAPTAEEPVSPTAGLREIEVGRIRPNPRQPRQNVDDATLGGLAQSLENQGVLQPIIVRSLPDGQFEIVAGERRWRAAQIVGLGKVPAIVRDVPDERLLELALVENLQREDLNPIEEALAYRQLAEDFDLTQKEIADRAGKDRATVANTLRLLALPKVIQDKIRDGQLTTGHGKALLSVDGATRQVQLAEQATRERLTVRDLERMVSGSDGEATKKRSKAKVERDPNVRAAEEELQSQLGTKVRIVPRPRGGRIELHCFSEDELDSVYQLILEAARRRAKSRPASA